jgi:hypothetical protein
VLTHAPPAPCNRYSRFGAGSNQAAAHMGPDVILMAKHATGLHFARKGKTLQKALAAHPLGPGLDGSTDATVYLDFELDGSPRFTGDADADTWARAAFGLSAVHHHCACACACAPAALRIAIAAALR